MVEVYTNGNLMCNFQNLYLENNCFVVRCKNCQSYQIGFSTSIFNCTREDFYAFMNMASRRLAIEQDNSDDYAKTIVLPTPYFGVSLFLSKRELAQLCRILDQAENEENVQSLMSLFNE